MRKLYEIENDLANIIEIGADRYVDGETGEIIEKDGRPLKLQGLPRVYEYLETDTEYYNKLKSFIENDINQSDVVKNNNA